MKNSEAFYAYKRAVEAYAQASAVAAKTGDRRHYKHAKIMKEIAHEKQAAWQAEAELQRITARERRYL